MNLTPVTTTLYDVPVPPKRRAVALTRGTCATVRLQLTNDAGDPVDLSAYSSTRYTFTMAFGEYVAGRQGCAEVAVGSVEAGTAGWCTADLPSKLANSPGIYLAQAALTDDLSFPRCAVADEVVQSITRTADALTITTVRPDTSSYSYVYTETAQPLVGVGAVLTLKQQLVRDVCLAVSNLLYVAVERGLLGVNQGQRSGMPGLAEVRMELRDYPEVNRLIDSYEFDEAEVLHAAVRCVEYFNEVTPELDQHYDTASFPWRHHWLEGIVYHLLRTAVAYYDRNKLNYSAGGVQVDDLGRSEPYLRHMQMRKQSWEDWVRRTKVRLNAESGFLSMGSDYSSGWW